MKTVWITCAILCACGCICCIGLFAMGRSLLQASQKADAEADAYALETVNAVCQTWDGAELKRRLAPDAKPDLIDHLVKAGKPLGGLRQTTQFAVVGNSFYIYNGAKTSRVKTGCQATFEHGTARLELTLTNNGAGWHVRDFEINPQPNDSGVRNI